MNHKFPSLGLIALLLALPLTAGAQTGAPTPVATSSSSSMYVRTEAGVGIIQDVKVDGVLTLGSKAGPSFAAALGFRTSGSTAFEAQIGHQNNKWKDFSASGVTVGGLLTGSASVTTFLAVTQFTNKVSDKSSLDIGVGLGSALVRAEIGLRGFVDQDSETDARFMGQLSGAWRTAITPSTDFTLGYRFGYVDGPKFSGGVEANRVLTHNFSAGFRFAF